MERKGSCACGKSTFMMRGEPGMKAICHCQSCRKLTGSAYSTLFLHPDSNFEMVESSALKTVKVKHEIGMTIEVSFCGECGTVLFKKADNAPNMTIVFVGTIDDDGRSINEAPQAELWTKYRVEWADKVGGREMKQFEGFP